MINRFKIRDTLAWAPTLAFILILLVGAFLRFKGISQESLYADEAGLVLTAEGVLERGYPSIYVAPEVPVRYHSTSELVSYLQALSFVLLGKSEFSLRLPSALFGILTIPLLYLFGKMIGGERVGLLASAVYSLLPSTIGMSHWARYPSELCFFGFLTAFLAFIYSQTQKVRYMYLCALSFLLTYFSWQGSALTFPSLLIGCIIIWKKERILKDLIIFIFIIGFVIAAHLSARFLETILIGSFRFGPGISGLTPKLMVLSPLYDPFYYIKNFFFIGGHQFLSILFFAGIPLVFIKFKTYKNLLFLYLFPLGVPFVMTNTLEIADYRYAYYMIPFLIICACWVLFIFLDYLGYSRENESLSLVNSVFASIMLISISSNILLNLKNFPGITEGAKSNPDLRYASEEKKAAEFIEANKESGDIIISFQPHLLEYYMDKDKADYFFESRLLLPVLIAPRGSNFIPVHRRTGTPAILSLDELKKIIGSSEKRVWLVGSPEIPSSLDDESREFIDKNKKTVFERYKTAVSLIGSR